MCVPARDPVLHEDQTKQTQDLARARECGEFMDGSCQ